MIPQTVKNGDRRRVFIRKLMDEKVINSEQPEES